jgi:hypothetical protein
VDLKEAECGIDVRTHWYYRTKRLPLNRYFAEASAPGAHKIDIVDIGSGSGVFSEGLIDRFHPQIRNVIRVDLHYADVSRVHDGRLTDGVVEHRRDLPDEIDRAFVLLMDVLEHVPGRTWSSSRSPHSTACGRAKTSSWATIGATRWRLSAQWRRHPTSRSLVPTICSGCSSRGHT